MAGTGKLRVSQHTRVAGTGELEFLVSTQEWQGQVSNNMSQNNVSRADYDLKQLS